jgi:TonB family protein
VQFSVIRRLVLVAHVLLVTSAFAQNWPIIDPCPPTLEFGKLPTSTSEIRVAPPRVMRKVEPVFTAEAQRARVAPGRVLLRVVVAPNGRACNIRVYSPMGLGLDEPAMHAIQQWQFAPATRNGEPIAVIATIEVNFVYQGYGIDRVEDKRGTFNTAVDLMKSEKPKNREAAILILKSLSTKKYPSADSLLALYYLHGEHVSLDVNQGVLLAERANKKNDRIGIYALGFASENGLGVPRDENKAFALYAEASTLGLTTAQLRIARAYATGKPYPIDLARAERTYRLCAVQGSGFCAHELAILLQEQKNPDQAEIGAWALIAQTFGVADAKSLLTGLSPEALREAMTLKTAILEAKRPL